MGGTFSKSLSVKDFEELIVQHSNYNIYVETQYDNNPTLFNIIATDLTRGYDKITPNMNLDTIDVLKNAYLSSLQNINYLRLILGAYRKSSLSLEAKRRDLKIRLDEIKSSIRTVLTNGIYPEGNPPTYRSSTVSIYYQWGILSNNLEYNTMLNSYVKDDGSVTYDKTQIDQLKVDRKMLSTLLPCVKREDWNQSLYDTDILNYNEDVKYGLRCAIPPVPSTGSDGSSGGGTGGSDDSGTSGSNSSSGGGTSGSNSSSGSGTSGSNSSSGSGTGGGNSSSGGGTGGTTDPPKTTEEEIAAEKKIKDDAEKKIKDDAEKKIKDDADALRNNIIYGVVGLFVLALIIVIIYKWTKKKPPSQNPYNPTPIPNMNPYNPTPIPNMNPYNQGRADMASY
jgi:hypothetical protein